MREPELFEGAAARKEENPMGILLYGDAVRSKPQCGGEREEGINKYLSLLSPVLFLMMLPV